MESSLLDALRCASAPRPRWLDGGGSAVRPFFCLRQRAPKVLTSTVRSRDRWSGGRSTVWSAGRFSEQTRPQACSYAGGVKPRGDTVRLPLIHWRMPVVCAGAAEDGNGVT